MNNHLSLQEHISFPFILDLSPFTKSTSTLQNDYALQKKPPIPNMQLVPHILKIMEGTTSAEEKGFRKFNLGGTSEKREEISQENQVKLQT